MLCKNQVIFGGELPVVQHAMWASCGALLTAGLFLVHGAWAKRSVRDVTVPVTIELTTI
jgi:hypothetical protein